MDESRRERIAARAHELWEQEGRPDNKAGEHWQRAEQEVAEHERAGQMGGRSEEPPAPDIDTRPAPPVKAAPPREDGLGSSAETGTKPGNETPRRRTGPSRGSRRGPQQR